MVCLARGFLVVRTYWGGYIHFTDATNLLGKARGSPALINAGSRRRVERFAEDIVGVTETYITTLISRDKKAALFADEFLGVPEISKSTRKVPQTQAVGSALWRRFPR